MLPPDFPSLLKKVPESLHLGLFEDETAKLCRWHVPAAHYLETWSDVRAYEGTYSVIQPMILPLWNGVNELDMLATLSGRSKPQGPELVRETFAQQFQAMTTDGLPCYACFPETEWPEASPLTLPGRRSSSVMRRAFHKDWSLFS